jgi:lipopolysaccharide transport system ATP-binding protein
VEPAIRVEDVGKRYGLGTGVGGSLTQALDGAIRRPFRRHRAPVAEEEVTDFWALRNVSLEVRPGEIFGVIGRNGSGKSTLLKLLSQITLPTEGRIELRGRVGTLLEVGTGFHPELNGRENIFLNGAILGMKRTEIAARYAEITEFAGISPQFLETPVKRYSSGMYVRLAFAVAAHLEPEILLVDEVLAVGDTEFQRKCIGKMDDVAESGRTVVFISHNLSAVQKLCNRSVWLEHGRVVDTGLTQQVIASYLRRVGPEQHGGRAVIPADAERVGTGEARLLRAAMLDDRDEAIEELGLGQPCTFTMMFQISERLADAIVEVGVNSAEGVRAVTALSTDDGHPMMDLEPGVYEFSADIEVTLLPGDYSVDIGIHQADVLSYDFVERVLDFSSVNKPTGDVAKYPWPTTRGYVRPASRWLMQTGTPADSRLVETEASPPA